MTEAPSLLHAGTATVGSLDFHISDSCCSGLSALSRRLDAAGRPWPCDSARQALRAEMSRTPPAIYMCGNLDEAVRDLPTSLPSELFERFISWTR